MKPTKNTIVTAISTLLITSGALSVDEMTTHKDLGDVETAIVEYQAKTGKYPHLDKGEWLEGKRLPENTRVVEYETARGERGYAIEYEDELHKYSFGFGPEAEQFTFMEAKPDTASSTRQ